MRDDELENLVEQIDVDGSGTVDMKEFMRWLRGQNPMAAKLRNQLATGGREAADTRIDSDPVKAGKRKLKALAEIHGG